MRIIVCLSEADWEKLTDLLRAGARAEQEAIGNITKYVPTITRLEKELAKAIKETL